VAHQVELQSALAVSGTTTYNSIPILTRATNKLSFQNSWTGTATGTLKYQGSNHRKAKDAPADADVVWTDLTTTLTHGTANPAGTPSNNITILVNPPFVVRAVFVSSSGSGTWTCQLDQDCGN
jgi:hypothetical protein